MMEGSGVRTEFHRFSHVVMGFGDNVLKGRKIAVSFSDTGGKVASNLPNQNQQPKKLNQVDRTNYSIQLTY